MASKAKVVKPSKETIQKHSERTVNTENYDRNGRETDIPYEDGI